MVFSKEDITKLKKLQKQQKEGKDINWEEVLDERAKIGRERWKRYGK